LAGADRAVVLVHIVHGGVDPRRRLADAVVDGAGPRRSARRDLLVGRVVDRRRRLAALRLAAGPAGALRHLAVGLRALRLPAARRPPLALALALAHPGGLRAPLELP